MKTESIIQICLGAAAAIFLALSITFIILFATKHEDSSSFLMSATTTANTTEMARNGINSALSNNYHVNSLSVDLSDRLVTAVFSLRGKQSPAAVLATFNKNQMFTSTQITDGSKGYDVCHATQNILTTSAKPVTGSTHSQLPPATTQPPAQPTKYCGGNVMRDIVIAVDLLPVLPGDTENKTQQLEKIGANLATGLDFSSTRVFIIGMQKAGISQISANFATNVQQFMSDWNKVYTTPFQGVATSSVDCDSIFLYIEQKLAYRAVPIEVIVLTSHATTNPSTDFRDYGAFVAVVQATDIKITGWEVATTSSVLVKKSSWTDVANNDPFSTLVCQYSRNVNPTTINAEMDIALRAERDAAAQPQVDNTCQKLDILFVIDTSQSVVPDYLKNYTAFAKNFAALFTLQDARDGDNSNVGLLTFSDDVDVKLPLGQHSLKDLYAAIDKVKYTGGLTATKKALAEAQNQFNTHGNAGHGKLLVFMTDGTPTIGTLGDCVSLGNNMTNNNIDIFFIGDDGYDAETTTELSKINLHPEWLFGTPDQAQVALPAISLQQFPCPSCIQTYFAVEASEITLGDGVLKKGLQIVLDTATNLEKTKNQTSYQLVLYNLNAQMVSPVGLTLDGLKKLINRLLTDENYLGQYIKGNVRLDLSMINVTNNIASQQNRIPTFQGSVLFIGQANNVVLDPLAETEDQKKAQLKQAAAQLGEVAKMIYVIDGSQNTQFYGDDLWSSVISNPNQIVNISTTDIQTALSQANFFTSFAGLTCALPVVQDCDQTFIDVVVAIDFNEADDTKITRYLGKLLKHFGTTYTAHFSFIAFGAERTAEILLPLGTSTQAQWTNTSKNYEAWRKTAVTGNSPNMTSAALSGMFDQMKSQFGCEKYTDDMDRIMATNVLLIVSDNFDTYTDDIWNSVGTDISTEWSCSDCPAKPVIQLLSTTNLAKRPPVTYTTYVLEEVDYDFTHPAANIYMTHIVGGICNAPLPTCCSYVPREVCKKNNQFWELN